MSEVKVYIFGDEYIGKCYQTSSEEYIIKSDYDKLQSDLKKAVEALESICGNKCAYQNPCEARSILRELRGEL